MPKIDDFITFKIRKQHPILVIYFIANTKGGRLLEQACVHF